MNEKLLVAKGSVGIFPANSEGDSVLIFNPASPDSQIATFEFLRNQQKKNDDIPNLCLADFIAPTSAGIKDFLGCFVVTAGIGLDPIVQQFELENDDYNAIMAKVLADRLAEAFAEFLHYKVRKEYWGYSPDEPFEIFQILGEEYQGIRPAPGYPACPEHSEKQIIFDLLDAEKFTGVSLTENFAMTPTAAVSGFYFAHPDSQYFNVGKIGRDQLYDYSQRKQISITEMERLLNSNLNYK